jgi:hypothetical protein
MQGKKVLIDGQHRVTALTTALVGLPVIDSTYEKVTIRIAFQPIEEQFEVLNDITLKDKAWIPDISVVIKPEFSLLQFICEYQRSNPYAVMEFMNETQFKRFIMIIKSAGFVGTKLIRSQKALNFAYVLYLHLREQKMNDAKIERLVRNG